MRVIAFACAHFCTPETQAEFTGQMGKAVFDYGSFERFTERVLANPPDAIVNLGDLNEPLYDDIEVVMQNEGETFVLLPDVVNLRGNHDPKGGDAFVVIDGLRYEHGHQRMLDHYHGKQFRDGTEYNERLRSLHDGERMIHGHTHFPKVGWAFDVGSITFSGTYAEVVDGEPEMRSV